MSRQLYFQGSGDVKLSDEQVMEIPSLKQRKELSKPGNYIFHPALIDAIDTALTLSMPLLLTGEPGTGKTQVAHSIANELNVDVIEFVGKSDSQARDLFYYFDTIGRYHASQSKEGDVDTRQYLHYQALGLAIIRAKSEHDIKQFVPKGLVHGGQRRSLVLIDEIDKTPRDFPNDLLAHIEQMKFRVPELGANNEIAAEDSYSPFVVITSNSERSLPDAFLRRCIYYHIPFPDRDTLSNIVEARLDFWLAKEHDLLRSILDFFMEIRSDQYQWRKKPGTAELLDWVIRLKQLNISPDVDFVNSESVLACSKSTLFKNEEDQNSADVVIHEWLKKLREKKADKETKESVS